MTDPVQFMSHHTAVEYKNPEPSLLSIHFGEQLAQGRIIGHKCPECGKVYMPPRGYCPLCVVETTEADEVEVANVGTITTFSVITPLQYQGQEETEDYVQATLLLDGADTTIMVMRMDGIAIGDVRMGMRVRAVFPPAHAGGASASASIARGMGLGDAVERWEPSGEPDLTREQIAEHIL
jgi:uncharacterized OB-fold protein